MTSSSLALVSQHGKIAAIKLFPFLDLSAELRNKVYAFVLLGRDPVVRIKTVSPGTDSISFFGLANANKQIRVELIPLLLNNIQLTLHLSDYPAFVTTFYGSQFKFPRPIRIRVNTDAGGAGHMSSWDFTPLILARVTAPGLNLIVRDIYDNPIPFLFLEDQRMENLFAHSLANRIGGRIEYEPWAYELHGPSRKALIRDIKSGYISEIRFRWMRKKQPAWSFVIKKKSGGLRNGELKKVLARCRLLRNGMIGDNQINATVSIKITDLGGNHVEEWFAPPWVLERDHIYRKVGRGWWNDMFGV